MANWRAKMMNWDPKNADWGGQEQIEKSIKDAQSNVKNLNLYGKGGIVLDLGSNIGEFAISASKFFDKVYCYESHPLSYEISIARTKSFPNIIIENKAVWSSDGQKLFVSTPENSIGSTTRITKIYPNKKEGYYREVNSIDFNYLLKEKMPRVIKMDIEATEYEVLPEANFNKNLEFISIEFHSPFVSKGRENKMEKCFENLYNNGFEIINNVNFKRRKIFYFTAILRRKIKND